MGSEIYQAGILGDQEVKQEYIDYWCNLCQFPLDIVKCVTRESIQQCWNKDGSNASVWHLQHECPFAHVELPCRCNDFKTRQEAFASAGLVYQG